MRELVFALVLQVVSVEQEPELELLALAEDLAIFLFLLGEPALAATHLRVFGPDLRRDRGHGFFPLLDPSFSFAANYPQKEQTLQSKRSTNQA